RGFLRETHSTKGAAIVANFGARVMNCPHVTHPVSVFDFCDRNRWVVTGSNVSCFLLARFILFSVGMLIAVGVVIAVMLRFLTDLLSRIRCGFVTSHRKQHDRKNAEQKADGQLK